METVAESGGGKGGGRRASTVGLFGTLYVEGGRSRGRSGVYSTSDRDRQ